MPAHCTGIQKETVRRTYSSWTWNICKPNICFLPFYSSMASQFFSPSIFTVVVQSAILIYIILWLFPMFWCYLLHKMLTIIFCQMFLESKQKDEQRLQQTAETSTVWDFFCIFYFINGNKSIQNHSMTACDDKQWTNQPCSTWKTKYLLHDFEMYHQCSQAAVTFCDPYCSYMCYVRFPQSALLNF